jgi:glycosyltransferase involved in cell wall biosynthesis
VTTVRRDGGLSILAVHWQDVCTPWRVSGPLKGLASRGFRVREEAMGALDGNVADLLANVDLVIVHRPTSRSVHRLLEQARARSIATVVDIDDLFLPDQLPTGTLMARSWHPLWHRHDAEDRAHAGVGSWESVAAAPINDVMERFHQMLRLVDAVTVSTEPLAAAYAPFNPSIYVLPNCYDDGEALWRLPLPPRATVNVGFAGTDHHAANLALLSGALEHVLATHPEARLVEAGGPELLPRVQAPARQRVHLASVPFAVFPMLLREMDIVLAPLADEPFMRCKSNIRCMTAGVLGIPVVASPVGPYAEYVRHGVNGFLAGSREEWTAYVARLVENPTLRRDMGAANRALSQEYALSRHLDERAALYEALCRHNRALTAVHGTSSSQC